MPLAIKANWMYHSRHRKLITDWFKRFREGFSLSKLSPIYRNKPYHGNTEIMVINLDSLVRFLRRFMYTMQLFSRRKIS